MNNYLYRSCKSVVVCVLVICVLLPLVNLLRSVRFEDIRIVLGSVQFFTMLKNSLVSSMIATLLSVGFAFLFGIIPWYGLYLWNKLILSWLRGVYRNLME